jgi:hypothetical protein
LNSPASRANLTSRGVPVRGESLVVRQIGPETLVYDRLRHRAHCLGPLAAAVWRACDDRRSAAEIARLVSAGWAEPVDERVLSAVDVPDGVHVDVPVPPVAEDPDPRPLPVASPTRITSGSE